MKQEITDIQGVPELPSHRQLFLNGAPFVVIHASLIEKFGLRIGLAIEAETIEKIIAADEVMRAKNYALRLLREEKDKDNSRRTRGLPHPSKTENVYQKRDRTTT